MLSIFATLCLAAPAPAAPLFVPVQDPVKKVSVYDEAADARADIAAALKTAKKDDTRVLLVFGANWCGWCHRLEAWLHQDDVAALLAKDFVLVKIDQDRMTGGMELASQLREGQGGGIPWVALYNGKGEKMATSSGPKGNVGCPVDPHEIRHFMNMLRVGAVNLTDKELAALEASLTEHGKKIRAGQ